MAGKIVIRYDPTRDTPASLLDRLAKIVMQNFDQVVGPHFVDVARKRVPVGKERRFNPRASSFSSVTLKPLGSMKNTEDNKTLAELHGLSAGERASFFQKAFGDQTDSTRATKFFRGKGGQSPTRLRIRRGTIQGASRHTPGTLRDSIRYEGARREGNLIIGIASANTDYAAAIHDGFVHRGGQQHKGGATKIPGTPYMTSSLANVKDDVLDADHYKR